MSADFDKKDNLWLLNAPEHPDMLELAVSLFEDETTLDARKIKTRLGFYAMLKTTFVKNIATAPIQLAVTALMLGRSAARRQLVTTVRYVRALVEHTDLDDLIRRFEEILAEEHSYELED